ncbi:hypothetical protein QQP08_000522 [Theobroma cacao]|nr:hypothetical protein QQP08_000522 [Theobroma cacao]
MSDAPKRTTTDRCPSAGPASDPRGQAFGSRSASASVAPTGADADLEEAVKAMKWKEKTKARLKKNRTLRGKAIRQENGSPSVLVRYFPSLSSKIK